MTSYSRRRKCVKGYGFLSFTQNLYNKYGTKLLDTGLDTLKTPSEKVLYKSAEVTGEFIGNKIVKPKLVIDDNSRSAEEIIIPPEKREEILSELRQVL